MPRGSQIFSESANHSGLQRESTAALVDSAEATKKGAVYADVAEGGQSMSTPYTECPERAYFNGGDREKRAF